MKGYELLERLGPAADVWGIGRVLEEAGGSPELVARCLRDDPRERPTVDALLRSLRGVGTRAQDPQPAA